MIRNANGLTVPQDDVRIWRYLSTEELIALLNTASLFFASLSLIDDPYEGAIPRGSLMEAVIEALKRQEVRFSFQNNPLPMLRRKFCVNCWHVNPDESAAMWTIYAGKAGVALKSSVGQLISCLVSCDQEVTPGLVKYIDYRMPVGSDNIMVTPLSHLKRKSYTCERELRVSICRSLNETIDQGTGGLIHGVNITVDLERLVSEFIVNPKADKWLVDAITGLVRKYVPSAAVTQDPYRLL